MEIHDTYMGIAPFGVLVDECPQLDSFVERARDLRFLPQDQKLVALKKLALEAITTNAYEEWQKNPDEAQREFFKGFVWDKHPLSYALQNKAGCCRYQGTLFFVLAYEAGLGDKHFLQQAPLVVQDWNLTNGIRSVFNDVVIDNKLEHVSIFLESLKDKSLDYSARNPNIFNCAIGFPHPKNNPCNGVKDPFQLSQYSYHRTPEGLIIVSEKGRHVMKYVGGK